MDWPRELWAADWPKSIRCLGPHIFISAVLLVALSGLMGIPLPSICVTIWTLFKSQNIWVTRSFPGISGSFRIAFNAWFPIVFHAYLWMLVSLCAYVDDFSPLIRCPFYSREASIFRYDQNAADPNDTHSARPLCLAFRITPTCGVQSMDQKWMHRPHPNYNLYGKRFFSISKVGTGSSIRLGLTTSVIRALQWSAHSCLIVPMFPHICVSVCMHACTLSQICNSHGLHTTINLGTLLHWCCKQNKHVLMCIEGQKCFTGRKNVHGMINRKRVLEYLKSLISHRWIWVTSKNMEMSSSDHHDILADMFLNCLHDVMRARHDHPDTSTIRLN